MKIERIVNKIDNEQILKPSSQNDQKSQSLKPFNSANVTKRSIKTFFSFSFYQRYKLIFKKLKMIDYFRAEDKEGVEELNDKERSVCLSLKLSPKTYLSVKDMIVKAYKLKGPITKTQARSLVKVNIFFF